MGDVVLDHSSVHLLGRGSDYSVERWRYVRGSTAIGCIFGRGEHSHFGDTAYVCRAVKTPIFSTAVTQ